MINVHTRVNKFFSIKRTEFGISLHSFETMNLLLFVAACFSVLLHSDAVEFYISPDPITNETCSDNKGIVLRPCYSIEQLSTRNDLLLNETAITLLFLTGTHVHPKEHTLKLSEKEEVIISAQGNANSQIECDSKAIIIFQHIQKLNISSLNFTSCTILKFDTIQIVIASCVFAGNKESYAIVVRTGDNSIKVNISINDSLFLSNNGALSVLPMGTTSSIIKSNSLFISATMFLNNRGNSVTLDTKNVDLKLYDSFFINNTAQFGGAISIFTSLAFISRTWFLNNQANNSGGAIVQFLSSLTIDDCLFSNNSAIVSGGAIFSRDPDELRVKGSQFLKNFANKSGGAIYIKLLMSKIAKEGVTLTDSRFENNVAAYSGGAVYLYADSYQPINAGITDSTFYHNRAVDGGAICCQKFKLRGMDVILDGGHREKNSAVKGGFLHLSTCSVHIKESCAIVGNNATHGGAIFANNSGIFSDTRVFFINNTARKSGGAIFAVDSHISLLQSTSQIIFISNTVSSAAGKGGAIYIQDVACEGIKSSDKNCPIQGYSYTGIKHFLFSNNSADSGSVLYGGLLDRCYSRSFLGIDHFKEVSEYEHEALAITSDPIKACFCRGDLQPDCAMRKTTNKKMRGEKIEVLVTSVDQDSNPLPSIIRASYEETAADLGEGEGREKISNCTTLTYHIFTVDSSASLVLQPEGVCERSVLSILTIDIEMVNCSRGFELKKDRCVCDWRLSRYLNVTVCHINMQSVERTKPIWFRYEEHHLRMTKNCPFGYCQIRSDTISLLFPDEQCANHRCGVLCGACRHNYSITLGGSKCLPCTDKYTFIWLVLVFAATGIALVALLLVCNMTISRGTLSGLIFYANVVSISGLASLPCSIHPVLSVFIAWVNLDLGVETCFYPGMDTYQKTWLQFAFPLYIILLVIAILVASYYSSTAVKVFSRNNIAILATLFLLSYSKALKTIISALSATQVLTSDADNVSAPVLPYTVWSYDGNIEYLKGKHVVLFTVALVFLLVLFLPYTLLLTFGQCLRSLPVRRRCVLRLTRSTAFISIMDSYHAPYNRRHRYWTGLMLLTRCVLFLAFAINYSSEKLLINSYITSLLITGLLLIKTVSTKIYRAS